MSCLKKFAFGVLDQLPLICVFSWWFKEGVIYFTAGYKDGFAQYVKAGKEMPNDYLAERIFKKNPKQVAGIGLLLALLWVSSIADRGKIGEV